MAPKGKAKQNQAPTVTKQKGKPKSAPTFALAKSMLNKLPLVERDSASATLWTKSAGKCVLCSLPLDLKTKDSVVADHYVAEAKGGKTTVSNLYLAHRACNASRQHLDFEIAQPLIRFQSVAEQKSLSFDDVIDLCVVGASKQLIAYSENGGIAKVRFGHTDVQVPVHVDPATSVKYFFIEVPIAYIHNDAEIQPRIIMPGHVRKLAVDFIDRPVHEPSNCRLVMTGAETGKLLQFDGQHKTTAQILLGRKTAPMKVYVDPPIDMLQTLVIKIQQEIKKQPLTKSETLAKIGDVVKRLLESYEEKPGQVRTEKRFVAAQPKGNQASVRKLYFDDLRRLVFFDEDNLLRKSVGPNVPILTITDKVVIDKIISPLMYGQLLDTNMDEFGARDVERKNILYVLNAISEIMLPTGWSKPGNDVQQLRARNFFFQGSIGWWMGEILEPSLRYVLYAVGKNKPLFLEQIDEASKERILNVVEKLCAWDIWSTEDSEHLKAMRSNTVSNVTYVFPEYTEKRLLKEIAA
jgi:hypothetical protein